MKYVITGYTGFLGGAIADAILAAQREDRIFAVCRRTHYGHIVFPKNVIPIWADMEEYTTLDKHIPSADVFIHCAWKGIDSIQRNNKEIQQMNVKFSLNAILASARMGCKVFVMTGSQAEYGFTNEIQTEDMVCRPVSEYGKAKLEILSLGWQMAEHLNISYIHLRIFSLYGPKDHPESMIMQSLRKMQKNERIELTSCLQNWNYLYVENAAEIITHLLDISNLRSDVFNIASNDTRPLRGFIDEMRIITETHSEIDYGAIKPQMYITLNPSIEKIKKYYTPSFITFEDGIRKIIKSK